MILLFQARIGDISFARYWRGGTEKREAEVGIREGGRSDRGSPGVHPREKICRLE